MGKRDVLQKLSSIRHAERVIAPDAAWASRTRLRVMSQVERDLASGVTFGKNPIQHNVIGARLMQWMRAPAMVSASIIAAVFGGSLLSVSASERALPGDFLYPIKLASEQTQLALTPDAADKLRLKTEFVGRRVEEIKTIVATPDSSAPDRLLQATQVLKRDLDTVKNQLQQVKQDAPAPTAVAVAKLVDQQSDDVAQQLKAVKASVPDDVKSSVAEAEVAAVHTGVSAVEVLIDTKTSSSSQDVISDADVAQAIQNKVDGIQASLDGSAQLLQSPSSTVSSTLTMQVASSSALQITTASATLQEVRNLVDQNKLDQVTDKLLQAAQTAVQVESAVDLATSSSTPALSDASSTPSGVEPSASSTPAIGSDTSTPSAASSTSPTTSSTSTPTPP
jgi:hypothetical protein